MQCSVLALAVGDSISVVLNLDAPNIGVANHMVAISTTSVDDNDANNQATTQVTVNAVVVEKKKSSGGSMPMILIFVMILENIML